ncbi:response regulator [Steroidobacter sp.]|uniref:hybrid sensor histidine kinase/response regulator n=1 Tax=Steroidobacter sp. TaxID=1978227 RepID=UPI001A625037|nr:response regulator [Steroidobacter sp.]MBL8266398.1 response regulator [Steroidobacter sp.]
MTQTTTDSSTTTSSSADAGPIVEPVKTRTSILLVDDQPARLLTYEAILGDMDLECVRALSGRDALKHLLVKDFALILLDVNMPGMDGFETARTIREHPRWERTPIIFVTGVNISELDQLKGYEVGAIDYISVPVVPEILRSKVAILVELHQRRRGLETLNSSLTQARAELETRHASAIAERDAQLKAIFEHPTELFVVMQAVRDANGKIVDWSYRDANANTLQLLKLTRSELLGRQLSDLFAPERASRLSANCAQVLESREVVRYESEFYGKDFLVTMFAMGEQCVVASGTNVTERKRAEAALRQSEARFREASERKDEFLAMLSHELRNPAAAIGNAAQALSRLIKSNETEQALVGIVDRQIRHLGRLLDDLLDVARLTQGRIEINRERLALQSCIEAAIETAQPLIQEKRHRLKLSIWPEPLCVDADKVRLCQCIANLLTNAAKYTEPGGDIHVRAFAEENFAALEIIDTGVGMPEELIPRVFELFVQGERPLDRSQGGLGVGLAVCRLLMEMQGGSIAASSAGIGKGSTFSLRLPLVESNVDTAASGIPGNGSSARILIVDDNRDAADSLALLLQLEEHATLTAYSSADALTHAATFEPHFVLLDIGLPEMDGYEVARRLKAIVPKARLIAISGYGLAGDKQRSAESGFEAHLVKPVSLDDIQSVFVDLTG